MAKTKAPKKPEPKKLSKKEVPASEPTAAVPPERVHELLKLHGPYDPAPEPPGWPDSFTQWDAGCSILEMRRKFPQHFYPMDWYEGVAFAKQTDSWRWKQFGTKPILPGKPYVAQFEKVKKGDEVPFAREVVQWFLLHFLATGERLEFPRLRCRDVLTSGRRVIVSFGPLGFDLGSVADSWESPGIALGSMFVPKPPAKKK